MKLVAGKAAEAEPTIHVWVESSSNGSLWLCSRNTSRDANEYWCLAEITPDGLRLIGSVQLSGFPIDEGGRIKVLP